MSAQPVWKYRLLVSDVCLCVSLHLQSSACASLAGLDRAQLTESRVVLYICCTDHSRTMVAVVMVVTNIFRGMAATDSDYDYQPTDRDDTQSRSRNDQNRERKRGFLQEEKCTVLFG